MGNVQARQALAVWGRVFLVRAPVLEAECGEGQGFLPVNPKRETLNPKP